MSYVHGRHIRKYPSRCLHVLLRHRGWARQSECTPLKTCLSKWSCFQFIKFSSFLFIWNKWPFELWRLFSPMPTGMLYSEECFENAQKTTEAFSVKGHHRKRGRFRTVTKRLIHFVFIYRARIPCVIEFERMEGHNMLQRCNFSFSSDVSTQYFGPEKAHLTLITCTFVMVCRLCR